VSPYLTVAQGQSITVAGRTADRLGRRRHLRRPIAIGIFTGRQPAPAVMGGAVDHREQRPGVDRGARPFPTARPLWLLVVLVVIISIGGPGSMVGMDFAKDVQTPAPRLGFSPRHGQTWAGYLASLFVMQARRRDPRRGQADISFESFRLALDRASTSSGIVTVVGILITPQEGSRP